MNRIKKLFFIGLMFTFFACVLTAEDLVKPLLDQGLKLYAEKDYKGAAAYLGQVIDINPNHDQARYYLIYSLALSGSSEEAYKHAQILVKRFPNDKNYKSLAEQMQKEVKRSSAAKKKAAKATKAVPKEIVIGGYQGHASSIVSKPKMGKHTAGKPKKHEHVKTPVELAVAKMDEGNAQEAEAMLNEILEKNPKNSEALHNLGVIKFGAGDYANAIEYFDKALKINAKSFQSLFLIGDSYRAIGKYEQAETALKKALEIKYDLFAAANLAKVFLKQNKLEEAETIYNKTRSSEPENEEAMVGLAYIKHLRGCNDEAAEMMQKVLSRAKGSAGAEAHYVRSKILLEAKLADDALEEAKRALEMAPNNVDYHTAYAQAALQAYHFDEALSAAQQALAQNPENIEARLALIEACMMRGDKELAEENIGEIEKVTKHPKISKIRAMAELKDGNTQQATTYYKEYLQLSNGQPKALLEYAEFLDSIKNYDEAKLAYNKIIEQNPETIYAVKAKKAIANIEWALNQENTAEQGEESPEQADKEMQDPNMRPGKVKF